MKLRDFLAKIGVLRFGKARWKVKEGRDLPYPAIDHSSFRNDDVMFDLDNKKSKRKK